jgi:hypothetical protein
MTLFKEKVNALRLMKQFLYDLMDPKKTPKVPKSIRLQARSVLKHSPAMYDIKIKDDEGKWIKL